MIRFDCAKSLEDDWMVNMKEKEVDYGKGNMVQGKGHPRMTK